ncbi:MAG TPA: sensor histidine kinase [Opitutaceae bacterium]|nr:sensor histidine kinase [Opitutaceae bacterium]
MIGFLLTHFVRRFLTGWGWKRLDWRSLMPRVFATGAVLSLLHVTLLTAIGLLLQNPEMGFRSGLIFVVSWVGNSFLFDGWLGAYFFYHLFERFNRLENERLRLVTSQQEAELRALKSQVNPHFIFNSLNSLRSLIEEEPARARLAVTQLANLLRYSLQSSQRETVPLEEELRVANDYLALEQVRYEDRLRLRIDVPPQALALPVPPMLLQTLVENAVKYGIAQRREGGEIAIVARYDGDRLRLQVTNPRAPDASIKMDAESTGVGLRNAAERLRLLFSDRATLQLRLDGADLVVAEVLIPMKPSPSRLP